MCSIMQNMVRFVVMIENHRYSNCVQWLPGVGYIYVPVCCCHYVTERVESNVQSSSLRSVADVDERPRVVQQTRRTTVYVPSPSASCDKTRTSVIWSGQFLGSTCWLATVDVNCWLIVCSSVVSIAHRLHNCDDFASPVRPRRSCYAWCCFGGHKDL